MMALARKVVSGDEEDVEAALAQTGDAETDAEELLVDDGWKAVEIEPEAIAVDSNGNGHHVDGIRPTVELVPANGHTTNGNGHHDESEELQQSLFSWSEFMAEPVKAKGRKSNAQAPSLSLFKWAVERERESEPVGAGR